MTSHMGLSISRLPPAIIILLRTLAIAVIGGVVAAAAALPLAWMIGAMATCAIAAIAGARVAVPPGVRTAMVTVLGVLLGSAFRPEMLDHVERWAVTITALVPYIVLALFIGFYALRRFAGFDRTTAYFTAAPGGLNEMVTVGGALGGDERTIALVHSARIMLVVFTIPLWFGASSSSSGPFTALLHPGELSLQDIVLLAACLLGAPLAQMVRIPAAQLVGPMILSAALHLTGLTEGVPPPAVVAIAQIVVGAAIGARFGGIHPRRLLTLFGHAILLTALLLALDIGFAFALSSMTGLPVPDLVLAYAPGGLSEMSLVALALGTDAAFVSTHHIVRIILIVTLAPVVFRLMPRN